MNKEELIKKWLDNNLNPEEQKAFEALEDYNDLIKLSNYSKGFKAPEFNSDEALQTVLEVTNSKKQPKQNWLYKAMQVAAVLVIGLGTYFYSINRNTNYITSFAEKTEISLPDNSIVNLNAQSKLSFKKHKWNTKRNLKLEGEAFFKVEKGSTFNVITSSGTVTVLGTQFNVKQRNNYFEVICYEGSVQVAYKNKYTKLKPGQSFLVINNTITNTSTANKQPLWLDNTSEFKSIPFKEVIAEFERQFNVNINTENVDINQLFTGKFSHNNINIAIQSITQPLQLKYEQTNKTITLKRE
ncbi:FecR family protein [Tenacibaculum adriaticum]|uniref:FecR family protein n=1 Tax=Tenacibaculum adriaticum TaxID=413713 RepID=A0A5S5DKV5_9FLAO|nr:FecR family protein [Tenacibaculum adriaticum]TYP96254.1 FecR family protein [Tenacibaculum adriaticum]